MPGRTASSSACVGPGSIGSTGAGLAGAGELLRFTASEPVALPLPEIELRDVDNQPHPVHFRHDLLAERAQPSVFGAYRVGRRVADIIVRRVGQAYVTDPHVIVGFDQGKVAANAIAVFDADGEHPLPRGMNSLHVVGTIDDLNLLRAHLLSDPVDGVELVHGRCFGGSMAFRLDSFFSCSRMYGSSSSTLMLCWSLMKYGDR